MSPDRLAHIPVSLIAAAWSVASVFAWGSVGVAVVPGTAEATTYRIHTRTAARATQHLRSDTQFAAPRVLSQSLTLSAYDLRDNQTGDLNATVQMRYSTDLGLARQFRDDALFDARFNDLTLDLAYLEWTPIGAVQLTAGRQWHRGPLGITDFDGVAVDWQPVGRGWRPFAGVAAGRDVQRGLTPFDPGGWDVQGLPANESTVGDDPWHLMAAANAGVARGRTHRLEVAARHHRRPRDGHTPAAVTRRVGATATASVFDPLTVTTTSSYHSLIGRLDRARIDAAYRIGDGALSVGVDHRRPVFDPGSIFNLFGAQPHRSGYATIRHPIEAIATTAELRGWTRLYFQDQAGLFDAGDDRAVGAAIAGHHRLWAVVPLRASWQLSAQTLTGQRGGDQYLGRAMLRVPAPIDDLFVTGRLTALLATPDHHRRDSGQAATAGLGAELGVGDIGELSVNVESRLGSFAPANTAMFALFELEAWR